MPKGDNEIKTDLLEVSSDSSTMTEELISSIIHEPEIMKKLDPTLIEILQKNKQNMAISLSVSIKVNEINDDIISYLKQNGAKITRTLEFINKIAVEIKLGRLIKILQDDRIISMTYDSMVRPL